MSREDADTMIRCVKVPLASLSDEARKSLGLRTRAEQASFEAEQTKKGLVKSEDDWVTPEEKQRRESVAKFYATLKTLVPDWPDVNVNPQFAAWLDLRPVPDHQTGREAIEAGVKALDAVAVADVFNAWKAAQKVATAKFVECLSNLIPDWREVNVNPKFLAWICGKNPVDSWTRFVLLQQAQGVKGAIAVGDIMHAWKMKVAADQQAELDRQAARQKILDAYYAQQAAKRDRWNADRARQEAADAQQDVNNRLAQIEQDQKDAADRARREQAAREKYDREVQAWKDRNTRGAIIIAPDDDPFPTYPTK
jgi:hypothetical protein